MLDRPMGPAVRALGALWPSLGAIACLMAATALLAMPASAVSYYSASDSVQCTLGIHVPDEGPGPGEGPGPDPEPDEGPTPSGAMDALWVENDDPAYGPVGIYGLADIKAAAMDLSAHGDDPAASSYHRLYRHFLDSGTAFHLKVGEAYHDVQVLGLCQDVAASGAKAGLSMGFKDIYAFKDRTCKVAGSVPFPSSMNDEKTNQGGWEASALRQRLRTTFFEMLDPLMQQEETGIVPVRKLQQLSLGNDGGGAQTTIDTVFVPSVYETHGRTYENWTNDEEAEGAFQYQCFAVSGNSSYYGNPDAPRPFDGTRRSWWLRSAFRNTGNYFVYVASNGEISSGASAMSNYGVLPCFAL